MYQIGKGKPKAKQVKLAQKARKPQAAKNGPKKAHPCNQCETSFNYPSELKRHVDAVHLQAAKNGPKKPFPCDQCESSFPYPSKLKIHIDVVHLGLKPHKCTQCDEAFVWKKG